METLMSVSVAFVEVCIGYISHSDGREFHSVISIFMLDIHSLSCSASGWRPIVPPVPVAARIQKARINLNVTPILDGIASLCVWIAWRECAPAALSRKGTMTIRSKNPTSSKHSSLTSFKLRDAVWKTRSRTAGAILAK